MSQELTSKPLIVGHRANTKLRLYYYLSLRVPVIEVDIVRDEQGELIIQHVREEELLLEEIKPKKKRILSRILEEVEGVFHRRLVDYLKRISGKVDVMLDLKYRSRGWKLSEALKESGFKGKVYVTSKYHKDLVLVKKAIPYATVLLSIEDEPLDIESYLEKTGVDGISIRAAFVEEDIVRELHKHKHIVAVWVVNDPELARYMAKLGVDMIITDKPREIMKTLGVRCKETLKVELLEIIEEVLELI